MSNIFKVFSRDFLSYFSPFYRLQNDKRKYDNLSDEGRDQKLKWISVLEKEIVKYLARYTKNKKRRRELKGILHEIQEDKLALLRNFQPKQDNVYKELIASLMRSYETNNEIGNPEAEATFELEKSLLAELEEKGEFRAAYLQAERINVLMDCHKVERHTYHGNNRLISDYIQQALSYMADLHYTVKNHLKVKVGKNQSDGNVVMMEGLQSWPPPAHIFHCSTAFQLGIKIKNQILLNDPTDYPEFIHRLKALERTLLSCQDILMVYEYGLKDLQNALEGNTSKPSTEIPATPQVLSKIKESRNLFQEVICLLSYM